MGCPMEADERDRHEDEPLASAAPTEPQDTVETPPSALATERHAGQDLAPAADRRRRADRRDHRAPGRRDLRHLGQSPSVQPRQLVEDEHPAAPGRQRPLQHGQLPRRSALRERQRRRADQAGPADPAASAGRSRRRRTAQRRRPGRRARAQPAAGPAAVGAGQPRRRPDVHRHRERPQGRGRVQQRRGDAQSRLDSQQHRLASRAALGHRLQAPAKRREPDDLQVRPAQVRPERRQGDQGPRAVADDHRAAAVRPGAVPGQGSPAPYADDDRLRRDPRRRAGDPCPLDPPGTGRERRSPATRRCR